MKKAVSMILIMVSVLFFHSCSGNEDSENLSQEILLLEDICGVWTDSSNSLYYIAIYQSGKYTYCFNNKLIGSGKCAIKDNTIYLNDEYTHTSDLMTINKKNNTLVLNGSITDINDSKTSISIQFNFSETESLSPSIAGIKKTSTGGLNNSYDNLKKEISFVSDLIFQYEYSGRKKSTNQHKTITSYTWRYVYRKPYTYGVKLNGEDSTVEIYDFPFVYTTDWGTLDLALNDFIIQQ